MTKRTFYETVAAAIKDMAAHGYDSQERLEHWRRLIEAAAKSSFAPMDEVERDVRKTMNLAYYRLVTKGGLLRRMPQIGAYTLQKLTPALQSELNRRIISSIDLIKLNRPVAIAKTVQRFSGWATSIPEGGFPSDVRKGAYKYVAVKSDLQKAMTSLPFEERRVIIDQNAKLIAAINTIAAEGGGAIAAIWQSHKAEKNYDGRPKHNARDGKMFLVRDNWAVKKGLVKQGAGEYTDSIEQPGEFVFCFPGDTSVNYANDVKKGYRRWYSGELATLIMESGETLRATPNHPILTTNGWVPAGLLKEGDHVFEVANKTFNVSKTDVDSATPAIADAFATLCVQGNSCLISGSEKQFHGDGQKGNVDIVNTARRLSFGVNSSGMQRVKQFNLAKTDNLALAVSTLDVFSMRSFGSSSCLVRGVCKVASFFLSQLLHTQSVCVRAVTDSSASFNDATSNSPTSEIKTIRQRKNAFAILMSVTQFISASRDCFKRRSFFKGPRKQPFFVSRPNDANAYPTSVRDVLKAAPFGLQPTKIIGIEREAFTGHVFNLETADEWYITNNIVVHNCRCSWVYIFNIRDLPADWLTKKGEESIADAKRKVKEMVQ